jgi:hypothetical protein
MVSGKSVKNGVSMMYVYEKQFLNCIAWRESLQNVRILLQINESGHPRRSYDLKLL